MAKRVFTLLLALTLLATCALAYTAEQNHTADALYELGLFKGRTEGANNYALDDGLKRDEGVTLLIRLLGKEQEALAGGDYGAPFRDVPKDDWSASYVGYAAKNHITNGVGKDKFDPDRTMSDNMFLTLVLRAMDYSDSGDHPQFNWETPYDLAKKLGLIDYTKADPDFSRGDAVEIFWNALDVKLNGSSKTLADRLVEQKVFTVTELGNARYIAAGNVKQSAYTYEEYKKLTPAQQQAYFESFSNPMDYINWYNAAKAAYDAAQKDKEITGSGDIDLNDLIKP